MTYRATFIGIALTIALCSGASARTFEETLVDLGICYNRCSLTSQTCTKGCCGILICKKGCVLGCDSALTSCKTQCETDIVGNPLGSAFFDDAVVSRNGRSVRVGGPLACVNGAVVDILVTLTQQSTGAIATGQAQVPCSEETDSFSLQANATGTAGFDAPGAIDACGAAKIRSGSVAIDAFQWCRTLTAVPKGVELEE